MELNFRVKYTNAIIVLNTLGIPISVAGTMGDNQGEAATPKVSQFIYRLIIV